MTGDGATAPAKVVAVVAAVSPEYVEPPTMSNPGPVERNLAQCTMTLFV